MAVQLSHAVFCVLSLFCVLAKAPSKKRLKQKFNMSEATVLRRPVQQGGPFDRYHLAEKLVSKYPKSDTTEIDQEQQTARTQKGADDAWWTYWPSFARNLFFATQTGTYSPKHALREAPYVEQMSLESGMSAHGEYMIDLDFGFPRQTFRLQVDTGSSSLILPGDHCHGCRMRAKRGYRPRSRVSSIMQCKAADGCGQNTCVSGLCPAGSKTVGNEDRSKTSPIASDHVALHGRALGDSGGLECSADGKNTCCNPLDTDHCGFEVLYGGGDRVEGSIMRDTVLFDSLRLPPDLAFGVVDKQDGQGWSKYADGILGLGFSALSCIPTCVTPFVEHLYSAAKEVLPNVTDMFGICFGNWGGTLAFGGVQSRHIQADNLSWTPMRTTGGMYQYYTVLMQGLSLDGKQVYSDASPALVDTGTTLVMLQPDLFNRLVQSFQQRYAHLPGVTGNTSVLSAATDRQYCLWAKHSRSHVPGKPDWTGWPTIELVLDGLVLQLPPSLYFWREEGTDNWCFGIQPTPHTVAHRYNLIGDVALRGFYTMFDREAMLIGFAPTAEKCGDGKATSGRVWSARRDKSSESIATTFFWVALVLMIVSLVSAVGLLHWLCCCVEPESRSASSSHP